jgi:hypothetical protein
MHFACSANALATLLRSVRQILSRILRDTTPARLRLVGFQANRRLLQVQRISHDTEEAFQKINRPVQVTSERASAASPILRYKLSGGPSCCSNSCPQAFPAAISANTLRLCWANHPTVSFKVK